jgi:hypothetical protein
MSLDDFRALRAPEIAIDAVVFSREREGSLK